MQPENLGVVHGGPLTVFTKEVAGPLHLGNRQTAAILVAGKLGLDAAIKSEEQAIAVLTSFLQFLLDQQRYIDAATLLWAPNLFSGEPRSVRMIWDAMFQNVAVMIPGAASMGKSYSLGVWMMLDWLRDPHFTNIQVVGPSETHLERNLFSHLVKLHRSASIPLPGEIRQLEITCDPKNKDSGILGVVVPVGKKASGRLQGVKVVARPKPHPQFGPTSRLRVILEEAENIPVGIFEDVTNIISNAGSNVDRFKIAAPFNPKDPNSQCAVRCEPVGGWETLDVETSETWMSKRGWRVVRLDAYKSENVVQGHEIFFGMQTKEGLEKLILNAGGVGTPGYYTMARGWYPPQGIDLAVIPQHLVAELFGTFEFVDTPRPVAGVDVALEGGDNAIFVLGKMGLAGGWRKTLENGKEGPLIRFLDPFNNPIAKEVIQVEQIFTLPKGDTTRLVAEIKRVCNGAYVKGEYLGVDRAGNGAGVHDLLVASPGFNGTKGVNPSESPTERKILQEDQQLPCDEYAYLISELWFAMRKYIEFGFLKISPNIPSDPLVSELTGRRFLLTQKKTKVESKKDYKSRGNKSPDRADGLSIMLHTARRQSKGAPSISGDAGRDDSGTPVPQRIGSTDRMERL
jgi:hypothetical protein